MKIFLDVGAHLGETLKIALESKYGFDKIYCFEPVPDCCAVLRTFKDERIVVLEYGLWNKSHTGKIYNPNAKGASLFKDKFDHDVKTQDVKLVSAGRWFKENIKEDDRVYLKINCEGAEVAILNDLIKTEGYKKISVLMVDFDVRKIPSQKHLMDEMKEKLNKLDIPKIFYIDEYNLGSGTHNYFTHYWLDNSQLPPKEQQKMKIISVEKTRDELAKMFKGIGAEIGVEQGAFSEVICKNPNVKKLYSIDAWKAYRGYRDHVRQEKLDGFFNATKERLKNYNSEIIRKFSVDAANDFLDERLDFVYIDANHDYKHVTEDLELWSRKVKKGGIVAGHDYIRRKGQADLYAVIPAVNDFATKNNIEELTIYRGDSSPSWMYVKP
jgi:FkbM family methyltransferase